MSRRLFPYIAVLAVCCTLACLMSATGPTATPRVEQTAIPTTVQSTESIQAPATAEVAAPATAAPEVPVFTVAVIVDTHSEAVSREQAQAVLEEAGRLLKELTPVTLVMTDFVEDSSGGLTSDTGSRYVSAHTRALPNGILIFSYGDGGAARMNGGYSFGLAAPIAFRNAFVSPLMGAGHLYVAVVDFSHRYAPCGYGGAEALQSATALDGECGNQPGTACLQQNGYSMCANAAGSLYAATPTRFASSLIVHQLLLAFAPGGDKDAYSTPECSARMGYPQGYFDLQEAQYHNDLCPSVYEEFVKSYKP
jgi:hypothetical protein